MLYLFFLPLSFGIECVPPTLNDLTIEDPSDESLTYRPSDIKNFKCQDSIPLHYSGKKVKYSRTCKEDGTWSGVPLICGYDVAGNLPFKTSEGYCQPRCKASTQWEIDLLEAVDVEGVQIILDKTTTSHTLEIVLDISSSSGKSVSCLLTERNEKETSLRYSHCAVSEAETIKISSNVPILLKKIAVISTNSPTQYLFTSPTYYNYDLVGTMFALSQDKKSYPKARESCLSMGGELLGQATDREWTALRWGLETEAAQKAKSQSSTVKFYREPRWIGLSVQRGVWRWESGQVLTSLPNTTFTAKPIAGYSVVVLEKDWHWSSAKQFEEHYYICRLRKQKRGIKTNCGVPGAPEAGYIDEKRILPQEDNAIQSVTYKCIDGYDLVGKDSRNCNFLTGQYDNPMPRCVSR